MKRQLILEKQNDDYILKNVNDTTKQVLIKNKTIEGEKIYSNFYTDIDSNIEYEITTQLSENQDKIIYTQLSTLFNKIDYEVNKALSNTESD